VLIVRPTYFKNDDDLTVRKLHLVYDDEDMTVCDGEVIPNYVIEHRTHSLLELLNDYFKSVGISKDRWKLTPPTIVHIDELDERVRGASVI